MSIRVLISTAPSSQFEISTGSSDPNGYNSFTAASTSRWIDTSRCRDLELKILATADWVGVCQWESAETDPTQPGAVVHPVILKGTSGPLTIALATPDVQVPTQRASWVRFNLVTQTSGGPLIPSLTGWGLERLVL